MSEIDYELLYTHMKEECANLREQLELIRAKQARQTVFLERHPIRDLLERFSLFFIDMDYEDMIRLTMWVILFSIVLVSAVNIYSMLRRKNP
jgi:ABC-type lipoprotein release transport system permease subunit